MPLRFKQKLILSVLATCLTAWTCVSSALDDVHIQLAEPQSLRLMADMDAPLTFQKFRNISEGCDVSLGDIGQSHLIGIAITSQWKVVQILSLNVRYKDHVCPLLFGRLQNDAGDAPFVLLGDTTTSADGAVSVSYARYGDTTEDQIRTLARVLVDLGPALPAFILPIHLEPSSVR